MPQDIRDAKIVTLYKNKGERSGCNNYRGISFFSIVAKVYARVLLIRLQKQAERVYLESQCGFRAERSTVNKVFSLRQLQEKCSEQQMPLLVAFIDLSKAFDKDSCPSRLHSLIESFHSNMKGSLQFNRNISKPFDTFSGVKQGCMLAPTLFGIFFALVLKHAFGTAQEGIYLRTRSDGSLFNLARLKARTKVRKALIRNMLLANDAAVVIHTQRELQLLMDRFSQACKDFGLTISLKMTNILGQDTSHHQSLSSMTTSSMLFTSSHILGPPSPITSPLTLRIDKRIG